MKIQKSDAMKAKFEALKWLRLDQRCMFIATEVGGYSADVLGINEKKMIEVEVKVTLEDFKNDFRKPKHRQYVDAYEMDYAWHKQWVPTHFYFAVLPDMIPKVKEYLEQQVSAPKAKSYGIIDMSTWKVVKRAQWLHKREPTNRAKCTVALRMGSELIRFHEAWL